MEVVLAVGLEALKGQKEDALQRTMLWVIPSIGNFLESHLAAVDGAVVHQSANALLQAETPLYSKHECNCGLVALQRMCWSYVKIMGCDVVYFFGNMVVQGHLSFGKSASEQRICPGTRRHYSDHDQAPWSIRSNPVPHIQAA